MSIIQNITEILDSWKFKDCGDYYQNDKIPIKLVKTQDPKQFLIEWDTFKFPDLEMIPTPPPIETNVQLLNIISNLLPAIVSLENFSSIGEQALYKEMEDYVNGIFNQFPNVNFNVTFIQGSLVMTPSNAYTVTLFDGIQRKFKVLFSDGTEKILEVSPNCISYKFLKETFESKDIDKVFIEEGNEYIPYFGRSVLIN